MELRQYYQKIRAMEANIFDPFVVVISLETPDGGVEGTPTEVSRLDAAKLVVDGRVRLATAEETTKYFQEMEERRKQVQALADISRIQLSVLSDADLKAIKGLKKG